MKRTLKAKLFIGCPFGGKTGGEKVTIEVDDVSSSTEALVLEMSLEDFGRLIATNQHVEVDAHWNTGLIGNRREVKTLDIYVERMVPKIESLWNGNQRVGISPEDRARSVGMHEVDGWVAYVDDLFNHNKRKPGEDGWVQKVSFSRFVDITTGEPVKREKP